MKILQEQSMLGLLLIYLAFVGHCFFGPRTIPRTAFKYVCLYLSDWPL